MDGQLIAERRKVSVRRSECAGDGFRKLLLENVKILLLDAHLWMVLCERGEQ